ncbi:MAG: chromate transporter [Gammaproteobacteria bacterium]|nr:chromate transporter [Gammaproteobacteria bacterium]
MKFKKLLLLFWDYFKIGLFTFGGGYAMISLIQKTFVEKRKYITDEDLLNIVAIAEATPGVIAVNSATYIGYKVAGFLGSLFATIGVVLPSFIIILILSFFYEQFIQIEWIKAILSGLMIAVIFLIFRAGIKLFKSANKDWISYVLIALSFSAMMLIKIFKFNFSSIYIIIIGGAFSLIVYIIKLLIMKKKDKKEEDK